MDRLVFEHNSKRIAEALEKAATGATSSIDRALGREAIGLANDMRQRAPKFRSELINAIAPERVSPFEHHVVAAKEHASYLEEGTKGGGRPTLATMLSWIRLKNITPRTPGMSQEGLAAVLRRTIAAHGIKAQPFAEPALAARAPGIRDRVHASIRRALEAVKA